MIYASSQSKAACDTAFYHDMKKIAEELADALDTAGLPLFEILFLSQAELYYQVVKAEGDEAYCRATTNNNAAECAPYNVNTDPYTNPGSEYIGNEFSDFGRGFATRCELWRFPDGNGGYYLLYRNCHIAH
ncbi:hypothetical protein IC617_01810 [Neiella sp. HB171785]|uniref:Uncharacterized protein n=1 Tax=Neiella litorisoli TaxID=2771431 RepID=A0A8J6UL22_9GAMM|nr:hypothetical protein [Neiella litorisoli]MBD1388155.1 hypothetical protein [Neiella litorisoli]